MFPDARISLRRLSVAAGTKIPIPVAITLHNFIPPSSSDTDVEPSSLTTRNPSNSDDDDRSLHGDTINDNESPSCSPSKEADAARRDRGMWLHRQPQHDNNLLPRLRLDITATLPYHQEQCDSVEDIGEEATDIAPTVVYSENSLRTQSIHPSWEHIDERIFVDEYGEWWNQNELYKSMKVRLSVVSNPDQKDFHQEEGIEDDCFLEAYLHPSFLERIDLGSNKANNRIESGSSNSTDDDVDRNSLLPPALPPNAMLVHFSDGSIRCPPQIYQILWDKYGHSHGILDPPPVEDFSRFEDDAFATLDHVKQTPQRPRNRSVSSLLDQDYTKQNDDGINRGKISPSSESSRQRNSNPVTPPRRPFNFSRAAKTKDIIAINQNRNQHEDVSFRFNEQDILKEIAIEERRQEKKELLRLIAEEERGLEEDLDCLEVERQTLAILMEEVQLVERDISKVEAELQKQTLNLEREEILKESQSVKLFRELRYIYPISLDFVPTSSAVGIIQSTRGSGGTENPGGNNGYLIRDLRLPTDIYTTTIPEEEVNTSLGYCAHLVFLVAKYLSIQLRHRIFCNGSRSAVELDGVGILPLFLGRLAARALEREQVDRGARLLGANVDCIMMHLNLLPSSSTSSFLQQSHILARLQTIIDFVAEGKSGE